MKSNYGMHHHSVKYFEWIFKKGWISFLLFTAATFTETDKYVTKQNALFQLQNYTIESKVWLSKSNQTQ